MALPKKKTRKISLLGTDYRWGSFTIDSGVEIRAELFENPASQLLARLDRDAGKDLPVVGPGLVAALIQSALDAGWNPDSKKPRQFDLSGAQDIAINHDLSSRKSLVCVVIAPLDAGASRVRHTLTSTVRELGLQVRDVADLPRNSSVVASVSAWIAEADLVVADVTRQNPNVFYEIGYAHALGKPTIHVLEGSDDRGVPAALSGNIFVVYSLDNLTTLHTSLKRAVLRFIRSGNSR